MRANEKRAEKIAEDHDGGGCRWSADRPNLVRDIAYALDAAERRGEERVLRAFGAVYGYGPEVADYRRERARRARVGRGRK